MRTSTWLVASLLVVGCGEVKDSTPDANFPPSTFVVGGTVTGLGGGQGLTLQLNGANDLAVNADGSFMFPVALDAGASYAVTISAGPTCPQRMCTLARATGMIASAHITDVTVTCAEPKYRLFSHNWGGQSLRISDDVLAIADNGTATPRIVTGAQTSVGSTEIDSLVVDPQRDLIYATSRTQNGPLAILVFTSASTATGDIAPARRFNVAGETNHYGLALDAANDRLYVSGASNLYIFNAASTLTGAVTPTATIPLTNAGAIALDTKNDRLFVAARASTLYVFDGARTLTSASTATRTATWTDPADTARGIAIDSCRNRLYLGFRNSVAANQFNIFAFDSGSTLNGAITPQTTASARIGVPGNQVMSLALDSQGGLYYWEDSANRVYILTAPHMISGSMTPTPNKTILGVVDRGYGLDVVAY